MEVLPDLTGATVHEYRVTSIAGLASTEATTDVALDLDADLDGDNSADNRLGEVLVAAWGLDAPTAEMFPIEPRCAERLAGEVGWMVTLYDGESGAGVALTRGVDAGGVLRPNPGDAAPAIGWDLTQPLTGAAGMTPLGLLTDPLGVHPAGFVAAVRARIVVDSFTPDEVVLRVAVALPEPDVDALVIRSFATYFTTVLANGPAPVIEQAVDTDGNGVVTEMELRESPVVESLLSPDIRVENVDALSFGLRITATAY